MVKNNITENETLDTKIPQTIALREGFGVEEVGKKIWEKEIVLDEKTKPLKTLLHKHLAFFSDFVELTEGKKVQIRITSQESIILIEIFSFNGATTELIEKKYYEYVDYTLSEENDTKKISFSDKISLVSRIIAEGNIGFEKGIFTAQKERIEELKQDKVGLMELAQILAKKFPDQAQTSPTLVLNVDKIYGNINLGENNQIINQKIGKIIQNNPENKDLKNLLDEVNSLKDKILESDMDDQTKQESLEYVQEIADNIEQKDQPDKFKILKKAGGNSPNLV